MEGRRNAREQIFLKGGAEETARLEERSRGHDLEQFLLSKRRGKRIRPGTKGGGEGVGGRRKLLSVKASQVFRARHSIVFPRPAAADPINRRRISG